LLKAIRPGEAPSMRSAAREHGLVRRAAVLFFLSGAASLVDQVAWQRLLGLHSGMGLYSSAVITAAFLGGLGLGSLLGARLSAGRDAGAALRAFAAVELGVAAFAALSPSLYYDWLYPRAVRLASPSPAGALSHFAALLPPTALMGASLPLLVRAVVRDVPSAARAIGRLYAVNTLGAAAGALAAPWILIPRLGLRGALWAAACASLAAALGAIALARGLAGDEAGRTRTAPPMPAEPARREPPRALEAAGSRPFGLWLALYALSGFLALALEIVWFRVVDVAVKSTAFTFGSVLAGYLFGLGVGCLLASSRVERIRRPLRAFLLCQCAALCAAALGVTALVRLPAGLPPLRGLSSYWAQYEFFAIGHAWDASRALLLYGLLPALLFGVPTLLMGFSFPVLQRAVQDDVPSAGRKAGLLQAANVAGCVAGSLLVGLGALSWLGTSGTLRALVAASLVFAAIGSAVYGRSFLGPGLALATAAIALPGAEPLWRRLHGLVDPQKRALFEEDATGVVAITAEGGGAWRVTIEGKGQSWIPYGNEHTLLGALPVLMHPAPRRVALIGLGSGDTAWAAACRTLTERVTVFEVARPLPRILERLLELQDNPELRGLLEDPRVAIQLSDGRHALELDAAYDVIESDVTWPEAALSGNLYSIEFFSLAARRLRPGGLMCAWVPSERARATFLRVFPYVVAVDVADGIYVGSLSPLPFERDVWLERLGSVEDYLGRSRVETIADSIRRRTSPAVPRASAGDVNEDLFPRDEFASPARPDS
jgi:predicted membrane-bound spermidine synthase